MQPGVLIALVGLCVSIIVNLISIGVFIGQMKGFKEMTTFRFNRLEGKQDKYNHLQERVAVLERDNKTAFHLIEQQNELIQRLGGIQHG